MLTHPDIAALVPLFASQRGGFFTTYLLSAKGEERVVQRSTDRVSKLCIV